MEKIWVNFCFETSERVLTADDNSKVISQILQLTLALYFQIGYFNLINITNQIKYYLPINRGNFL